MRCARTCVGLCLLLVVLVAPGAVFAVESAPAADGSVAPSAASTLAALRPPHPGAGVDADPLAALEARHELRRAIAAARARGLDLRSGVAPAELLAAASGGGSLAVRLQAAGAVTANGVPLDAGAAAPPAPSKAPKAKANGRVVDTAGKPLKGVTVFAYRRDGSSWVHGGTTTTKKNGTFVLKNLVPGTYVFFAQADGFVSQLHDGVDCRGSCDLGAGTLLDLAPKQNRGGVDFTLQRAGAVVGALRDDGGQNVRGSVWLHDANGAYVTYTEAGADGSFRIGGLLPGVYRLYAQGDLHVTTLAGDLPCPFFDCDPTRGATFDVVAGAETRRDVTLPRGGRLRGTVRDTGGAPIEDVTVVLATPDNSGYLGVAVTDADGTWTLAGVPAREHSLLFYGDVGVLDEAWNDSPCPELFCGTEELVTLQPGEDRAGMDATLSGGGAVEGRIVDADSGAPVSGVPVGALDPARRGFVAFANTAADGTYRIAGIPPGGRYLVATASRAYVVSLAGVGDCPNHHCSTAGAREVRPATGETVGGVDLAVRRGASIAGVVLDGAGTPLRSVQVRAVGRSGRQLAIATTNPSGAFTLAGLEPGRYWLHLTDIAGNRPRHAPRLHGGGVCASGSCTSFTAAGAVDLTAGQQVSGLTLQLTILAGSASGTVRGPWGRHHGLWVYVADANGTTLGSDVTDGLGEWRIDGLPPGSWRVLTDVAAGVIGELWNDHHCPYASCSVAGDLVTVYEGGVTTGVDFDLAAEEGRIRGHLVDSSTGGGAAGDWLLAVTPERAAVSYAFVGPTGRYTLFGLPAGDLRAVADNFYQRYLEVVFPNTPCPSANCLPAGTPLAIAGGNVHSDVDLQIGLAATLGGRVTSTATGGPLLGVRVDVYDAGGRRVSRTTTDRDGRWESWGLPPATYFVTTSGVVDHEDRVRGGGACEAECNPTAGTPVALGGASIGNLDFALNAIALP